MKLRLTFEFDERARRAITHYIGGNANYPANRKKVEGWIRGTLTSTLQILVSELDGDTCDDQVKP